VRARFLPLALVRSIGPLGLGLQNSAFSDRDTAAWCTSAAQDRGGTRTGASNWELSSTAAVNAPNLSLVW